MFRIIENSLKDLCKVYKIVAYVTKILNKTNAHDMVKKITNSYNMNIKLYREEYII